MARELLRTERADEQVRGKLRWIFGASPWLAASVLAVLIACAADLVTGTPAARAGAVALVVGLSVLFRLFHGVLWSAAWALIAMLPKWARVAIWPLAGTSAGVWLAYVLGSFTPLRSRYGKLAVGVLVGGFLVGLMFGVVLALYQAARDRPGWLQARPTWLRLTAAVLLI